MFILFITTPQPQKNFDFQLKTTNFKRRKVILLIPWLAEVGSVSTAFFVRLQTDIIDRIDRIDMMINNTNLSMIHKLYCK